MAMGRMGASQFTPHGMRSAFRDWAGDETDFARETVEMALAHMVKDATEAAYRRSTALEKRRRLLIAWDAFLSSEAEHRVILITARRASCA
jgi:integrase